MEDAGVTAPQRIQMQRTKGWRMPPNTVKVDRSTKWGNSYRPGGPVWRIKGIGKVRDHAEAVALFQRLQAPLMTDIAQLRGKNLACWCKPGQPCHADVLLELANKPLQAVA
jgi:hypothetical protein